MKSKWFEYKKEVRNLRRQGYSMTHIERTYGIPRSTLSGWFRDIPLSEVQRTKLMKNSQDGWKKARVNAVKWHNQQKKNRLVQADHEANETMKNLELTPEVLDIALAMLYFGEGAKSGTTSIANSNPVVLRFVLTVLYNNYGIMPDDIRCDLHLRADQDEESIKQYWAQQLSLRIENFKYTSFDQRTKGKPTYEHYKGVCVITCHKIAIQRKLIALYNQFCRTVSENMGA